MKVKYIHHEFGLRCFDEKIGWFYLTWSEMHNVQFTQNMSTRWMIFNLDRNIVFNSLGRNTLCLEFVGKAIEQIYMKIIAYFEEEKIKFTFLDDIP